MTELDPEEEAVLERARRAFAPPDGVTERMRAALLVKVAAPGIVVGASAAASNAAASSAAASSAVAASGAASGAAAASVVAAAAGSAAPLAAAAGGVVTGAKVAVGAGLLKAAAGVTTAVLLATATSPYWLPEASAPAAAPARATTTATSAGHARTVPDARTARGPVASPASKERASSDVRSRGTVPSRGSTAAPAPSVALPRTPALHETPEQRLQLELDLLRRAQRAIQAGQAGSALDLLAKLDAEHPASSLGQEREVTRVLALCGAGRVATARQVAQRVLAASPNSLYASRIQASCAALPSTPSAEAPEARPGKSTPAAPPVARFGDSGN